MRRAPERRVAGAGPGPQTRDVTARATLCVLGALALSAASWPASSSADPGAVVLPPVTRDVPDHPPTIFSGCTLGDRALIESRITMAIALGAPTYNAGDFLGCYRLYETAAREIEAGLSHACAGPARAMRDGRLRALALSTDADRAWAMRDAFDGVLLALERY